MLRYYLFENPWTVIWCLSGFSLFMLIGLRVTQMAKFLVAAIIGIALALSLFVADWLVITDAERVETIVHELANAVESSDADRVFPHLDLPGADSGAAANAKAKNPFFMLGERVAGELVKQRIRSSLQSYKFDFVKISGLKVEIREQSRTSKAEFKTFASAFSNNPGIGPRGAGALNSQWTLMFRETAPGVWKVYDIQSGNDRERNEVLRYMGIQ